MKAIVSISGKKAVNFQVGKDHINAMHVQRFNDGLCDQESLIEMKSFKSIKTATKWANKVLA